MLVTQSSPTPCDSIDCSLLSTKSKQKQESLLKHCLVKKEMHGLPSIRKLVSGGPRTAPASFLSLFLCPFLLQNPLSDLILSNAARAATTDNFIPLSTTSPSAVTARQRQARAGPTQGFSRCTGDGQSHPWV